MKLGGYYGTVSKRRFRAMIVVFCVALCTVCYKNLCTSFLVLCRALFVRVQVIPTDTFSLITVQVL